MESDLLKQFDKLIDQYKQQHKGEAPLYIILSSDENKKAIELIKAANNLKKDDIVTTYKGIKLAHHPGQTSGDIYVSNELPETGS